jgi:hypothetical protein
MDTKLHRLCARARDEVINEAINVLTRCVKNRIFEGKKKISTKSIVVQDWNKPTRHNPVMEAMSIPEITNFLVKALGGFEFKSKFLLKS